MYLHALDSQLSHSTARFRKCSQKHRAHTEGASSLFSVPAARRQNTEHFMLVEEGQSLCPNGLLALQYFLRKAYRREDHCCRIARVSCALV
jgi:hypothetical protein